MKKKIDRFVVEDVLSEGPGGSVYKAQEQLPGDVIRPVALKVLGEMGKSDVQTEQRFHNELRLLVSLSGHPNIVALHGAGMADRVPWIVMEWLPKTLGMTLTEQPATPLEVERMMRDVAGGLHALHGLNPPLLHNDLSPSNILVDTWGNCKISDFGLASQAVVDRTRVVATVRYAAPELLSRELGILSPATDLYALGHIAYEMALGGKLYRAQFPAIYDPRGSGRDASPAKWLAWHCSMGTRTSAVQDVLPDFPQWLGRIIAKLMSKTIAERYATAADLLAVLKAPATAADAVASNPSAAATAPGAGGASGTAPGDVRYYVRLRGQVSGPYDLATLQKQAKQGLISRLHQISADRAAWRSAGSVEGLF